MEALHLLYHALTAIVALSSSALNFRLYKRTESKESLYLSLATLFSALAVAALGFAVYLMELQAPYHVAIMITYALSSTSFFLYSLAIVELLQRPRLKSLAVALYVIMLVLGLVGHQIMKLIGDVIHAIYGILIAAFAIYVSKEMYAVLKDKRVLFIGVGIAIYTTFFGLTTAFVGTVIADIKLLVATVGLALIAYASR